MWDGGGCGSSGLCAAQGSVVDWKEGGGEASPRPLPSPACVWRYCSFRNQLKLPREVKGVRAKNFEKNREQKTLAMNCVHFF